MLSEMFSSAKDCALNPVTALVIAPKILMGTRLSMARRTLGRGAWTSRRHATRVPRALARKISGLDGIQLVILNLDARQL
jgi:hypothetical protein